MGFCKNMKKYRESKGFSQKELADKCNVSQVSIFKWENGKGTPTKNNALQLARVLGVTYADLMKEGK